MKPLFVLLPAVALTLACTTYRLPVPNHPDGVRLKEIVEREQQLTSAIAQWRYGVVSTYLAKDFRCAVAGHTFFTYNRVPSPGLACTGFGHDRLDQPVRAEWLYFFESPMPRTATIEDMAVRFDDDGSAVVVSLQAYTSWLPYYDSTPRRSRVTDTWVRDDGQWRLLRRYSEPLAKNAPAKLLPAS